MILLDTCTLLWMVSDSSLLSEQASRTIRANAGRIFVSSISALEIGIKTFRKKLSLPLPLKEWYALALSLHGVKDLPLDWEITALASTLPRHHDDPFDRLIIASAILHEIPVITPDASFRRYRNVESVW